MNAINYYSTIMSEMYDNNLWFKNYNYAQIAKNIVELLGSVDDTKHKTLLELASGTGSFLNTFSDYYGSVTGLELSTHMREISLKKYPQFPVHLGNMIDFSINQSFDTIALLCASIIEVSQKTEVDSLEAISSLIRCCRKHLKPNGVVIIETYEQPHTSKEWVTSQQYTFEDKYVSQHSVKTMQGNFATLTEHFLVSPKDTNGKTEYIEEVYIRYLYTTDKLISLFKEQGFELKAHVPSFVIDKRDLLIFG